ncbi:cryptochrome/photolyase family protein [Pontivivens ytuae]|uniref:Deoxyribodipyrimidine photo-lyase n=1 Tax=Pontivivens ytuae TaxID=2789856 RepID=A0A7S9LQL6_9RHOB|nr:deoxyribodipyrimidine photo-lyase [Pontivivens ytuae]QPH53492.1 deoxyribodipyrimidine photo-lyase [Pontivivens ytuae]
MPSPTILWLRRDLRLSDHPALVAAIGRGGPVIPVFIRDGQVDDMGAAPKWRLGLSLDDLAKRFEEKGSRLIFRSGEALDVLLKLVEETGATAVHWSRLYDSRSIDRDSKVKSALKDTGIEAVSHEGHVLHEPWTVETGTGGFYKVYTPYWKAVKDRDVPEPEATPSTVPAPDTWPSSETLEAWALGTSMRRGADVVARYVSVGEEAARGRLGSFMGHGIHSYSDERDRPDHDGTSRLSQHLALGEIGIRTVWHAAYRQLHDKGGAGPETFLKELVWRDFAWHLIHHTPHIRDTAWREEWAEFPWQKDNAEATKWKRGLTGEPIVDAGMRELYVTGYMHNRVRMIVASYLTKHLMTSWRVGHDWFEDCLVDHDPASNALGWQWSAGSGPDATPYFRVFNPQTQAEKFDPDGVYRKRWLDVDASDEAAAFYDAIPESWGLSPDDAYPERMIGLKEGRQRALDAYEDFKN